MVGIAYYGALLLYGIFLNIKVGITSHGDYAARHTTIDISQCAIVKIDNPIAYQQDTAESIMKRTGKTCVIRELMYHTIQEVEEPTPANTLVLPSH